MPLWKDGVIHPEMAGTPYTKFYRTVQNVVPFTFRRTEGGISVVTEETVHVCEPVHQVWISAVNRHDA